MPSGSRWSAAAYPDYRKEVNSSISFTGRGVEFFAERKARWIRRIATAWFQNASALDCLDVGCGTGLIHPFLGGVFDNLTAVDISEQAIQQATLNNYGVRYLVGDGISLPFADGSFDICYTVCVMHHMPPQQWTTFISEMGRIIRSRGLLVVFEHNPINPLTVAAVRRCKFDDDAILIRASRLREMMGEAEFSDLRVQYINFSPLKGRGVQKLEDFLGFLPIGAQYFVSGRK